MLLCSSLFSSSLISFLLFPPLLSSLSSSSLLSSPLPSSLSPPVTHHRSSWAPEPQLSRVRSPLSVLPTPPFPRWRLHADLLPPWLPPFSPPAACSRSHSSPEGKDRARWPRTTSGQRSPSHGGLRRGPSPTARGAIGTVPAAGRAETTVVGGQKPPPPPTARPPLPTHLPTCRALLLRARHDRGQRQPPSVLRWAVPSVPRLPGPARPLARPSHPLGGRAFTALKRRHLSSGPGALPAALKPQLRALTAEQ